MQKSQIAKRVRSIDAIKDLWLLVGRLFPFPTKPGLRRAGNPDRSSPVLVTANFELTVRRVVEALDRDGIDAWVLVAPTKGVNVWCAGGAGEFTADTVVSILKTSGIEKLVDHRRVILPQLSANGVNIWAVRERTIWKPRFGPADIKDLAAYLRGGRSRTARAHRRVKFPLMDRLVMGTNLGFNAALLLVLPLLIGSIWIGGLWWKTLLLIFVLSVLSSVLAFWLPGKVGVQKGVSLGLMAAAMFVAVAYGASTPAPWSLAGWSGWILVVSVFVGYDMPSWSPLWRQDVKELILGVKNTHVEIIAQKCIGCHLCDIVCPANVFSRNSKTKKYEVVNLDACQACGACVRNCPTDAIVNNFRAGVCSCPTCAVIDGLGALRRKAGKREPSRTSRAAASVTCGEDTGCECGEDHRV